MEPGKAWLRHPVAKVIGDHDQPPIIAGDQGSRRGDQYSKTLLIGEPRSVVSVGASPGCEPLPPGRNQTVDPLD
jgi:hypothetical protein